MLAPRFTGHCISANLPIINSIDPLRLNELRGKSVKSSDTIELEPNVEGEQYLKDIQVMKDTKVVVANNETRFEITDVEILVPLETKSKFKGDSFRNRHRMICFRWKSERYLEGSRNSRGRCNRE